MKYLLVGGFLLLVLSAIVSIAKIGVTGGSVILTIAITWWLVERFNLGDRLKDLKNKLKNCLHRRRP